MKKGLSLSDTYLIANAASANVEASNRAAEASERAAAQFSALRREQQKISNARENLYQASKSFNAIEGSDDSPALRAVRAKHWYTILDSTDTAALQSLEEKKLRDDLLGQYCRLMQAVPAVILEEAEWLINNANDDRKNKRDIAVAYAMHCIEREYSAIGPQGGILVVGLIIACLLFPIVWIIDDFIGGVSAFILSALFGLFAEMLACGIHRLTHIQAYRDAESRRKQLIGELASRYGMQNEDCDVIYNARKAEFPADINADSVNNAAARYETTVEKINTISRNVYGATK